MAFQATIKDKKLAVKILTESFQSNPSVLWVVKQDKKINKRIEELSKYAFDTGVRRNGVYISSDKTGVAICYEYNIKKESLADYWSQAKLAFRCIGLNRVVKVLKREAYIKKNRDADNHFLYFWFFGVSNKGKGKNAAKELKDHIFKLSDSKKLPIYLETSVNKNQNVYQRYGFETYYTWEDYGKDVKLWFMKKSV